MGEEFGNHFVKCRALVPASSHSVVRPRNDFEELQRVLQDDFRKRFEEFGSLPRHIQALIASYCTDNDLAVISLADQRRVEDFRQMFADRYKLEVVGASGAADGCYRLVGCDEDKLIYRKDSKYI